MPAPQRTWVDVPTGTTPAPGTPAVNAAFLEEVETYLETEVDGVIDDFATHVEALEWIEVGAVDEPAFENSWVAASGRTPEFVKDAHGSVHLRGAVTTGTVAVGDTSSVFTLPAGYRPPIAQLFRVASRDGSGPVLAEVEVTTTGKVRVNYGNNTLLALDGVSFQAA
jgi:hypothetical protein